LGRKYPNFFEAREGVHLFFFFYPSVLGEFFSFFRATVAVSWSRGNAEAYSTSVWGALRRVSTPTSRIPQGSWRCRVHDIQLEDSCGAKEWLGLGGEGETLGYLE
jgi:hypothetical protein